MDLWLNDSGINSDDFKLHIDLGLLSEDANQNEELDSEEDIYFGNGIHIFLFSTLCKSKYIFFV